MRYFDYLFVSAPAPYTLQGLGAATDSLDAAVSRYEDLVKARKRVWDLIAPNIKVVPQKLQDRFWAISKWTTDNFTQFAAKTKTGADRSSGWQGWFDAADLGVTQFSDLSIDVDTAIQQATNQPAQSAPSPIPAPPANNEGLSWVIVGVTAFFLWNMMKGDGPEYVPEYARRR